MAIEYITFVRKKGEKAPLDAIKSIRSKGFQGATFDSIVYGVKGDQREVVKVTYDDQTWNTDKKKDNALKFLQIAANAYKRETPAEALVTVNEIIDPLVATLDGDNIVLPT